MDGPSDVAEGDEAAKPPKDSGTADTRSRYDLGRAKEVARPYLTGIAIVVTVCLVGVVFVASKNADPAAWGLLVVAAGGLAAGGVAGFALGMLRVEGERVRSTLAAFSIGTGATSLFDLGRQDGLLRHFAVSTAAACGFRQGVGLVVMVFFAFAGFGFLAGYVVKITWLNPLFKDADDASGEGGEPELRQGDVSGAPPTGPAGPGGPGDGAGGSAAQPPQETVKFLGALKGPRHGLDPAAPEAPQRDASDFMGGPADDPRLGQFGGHESANGRRLTATISESKRRGWCKVRLEVVSTDPSRELAGRVRFYLHPTFTPRVVERPVVDGRAVLTLDAYGAFTVGAIVTEDGTRLELDLQTVPGAPAEFRDR